MNSAHALLKRIRGELDKSQGKTSLVKKRG